MLIERSDVNDLHAVLTLAEHRPGFRIPGREEWYIISLHGYGYIRYKKDGEWYFDLILPGTNDTNQVSIENLIRANPMYRELFEAARVSLNDKFYLVKQLIVS